MAFSNLVFITRLFRADAPLPSTFKWNSTPPLATPQNGSLALKDFTCVQYNGKYIVYFSTVNNVGNYGGGMMTFTNWSDMATATQYQLPLGGVRLRCSISPRRISGFYHSSGVPSM